MTYLIVILSYLFVLIGLGVWKSRKVKTQADFAVAGRSLSPWILVGTMLATWIGTGSILGNAGKTYQTGMAAFILPLGGGDHRNRFSDRLIGRVSEHIFRRRVPGGDDPVHRQTHYGVGRRFNDSREP